MCCIYMDYSCKWNSFLTSAITLLHRRHVDCSAKIMYYPKSSAITSLLAAMRSCTRSTIQFIHAGSSSGCGLGSSKLRSAQLRVVCPGLIACLSRNEERVDPLKPHPNTQGYMVMFMKPGLGTLNCNSMAKPVHVSGFSDPVSWRPYWRY